VTRVLVTGGGGFLGKAIVERLVARGDAVRSFSRGHYPALDALGVESVRGDLGEPGAVRAAVRGCDAVIHTAALAGVWGPFRDYHRANLLGTRHVLEACRAEGVERLVHTSTPSVVHDGGDVVDGDESLPYGRVYRTAYQVTKIEAEREVLREHRVRVVALRPHLVWGPGDPHLVPRIVARGRRGLLPLPDGGRAVVDTTYIDNAADAHVAALDALVPGAACIGRAYFITNGEPRPLREIVEAIWACAGVEARVLPLPRRVAEVAGAVLEDAFGLLRSRREPPLTRFVAEQLGTTHHFSIAAAARDLGWAPRVSLDEGFERLAAWFSTGVPQAARSSP
jgi:nucleoside-diphosphate-sugar epimerase